MPIRTSRTLLSRWHCWMRSGCVGTARLSTLLIGVVLWVSTAVGAASAADEARPVEDLADLRFGGTLPGAIRPFENSQGRGRLIRIDEGLVLALPEVEFRRVRDDDQSLEEYRRRLAAMEDTPEAHWEMSRWCNGERLRAQKERHLRRAIELDPNHGPARQELGYEPDGNQWVKTKTLRRERGMVRDGGKWRFAEEVMLLREMKDEEVARKEWIRMLAGLKTQVLRGGPRGVDAANQIRMIDDPRADEAVAKEFLQGKDSERFPRTLWLEVLGRLGTPVAIQAMLQASMNDPSPTIRQTCLERLEEQAKYQAIAYYLNRLKDKNNEVVRRAGRALIEVNDPEIALELIEALRTKHKMVVAPRNDTNVAMSPDGSGNGGMQFGGKAQVIERELSNPEVLTALLEIVPDDVNFQYDEERWRRYFASLLAPPPGNLRRDP